MKILIAGASGAIGRRLAPLLVSAGHRVSGMTRTSANSSVLRAAGAEPVIADILNREAVRAIVTTLRPDVIVHQATALSKMRGLKHFDDEFALTNRLRTEGTEHLLAAAQEAGVSRFVAQSYTGWPNARTGSLPKNEDNPLDRDPPHSMVRTLEAIRQLERMVCGAGHLTGIVLRYGTFYGPGTSLGETGEITDAVRRREFPIFGDGAGVWSFIHIDDAANATLRAVEHAPAGIYNIVDDEPAPVREWLPVLAEVLGAKSPIHLPAWIGRIAIGEAGILMMTRIRGSSNEKAKRVLGWRPMYATWRQGFRTGLSGEPPARAARGL